MRSNGYLRGNSIQDLFNLQVGNEGGTKTERKPKKMEKTAVNEGSFKELGNENSDQECDSHHGK